MSSKSNENHLMKTDQKFSSNEKRNIIIYIFGIALYKLGLEAFNGSIVTLATNRFENEASKYNLTFHTFEKVGFLVGFNQASQCLGAILVAPLIKHFSIRSILSMAIFIFAGLTASLMFMDACTGGTFKPAHFNVTKKDIYHYYGSYPNDWIFFIFSLSGITYGMIESIHRIIPTDILGHHVQKLQKMDALVHVFYALAGSIGAFLTGLVLIPRLGNNYAFIITPPLFTAAGMMWLLIKSLKIKKSRKKNNLQSDKFPSRLKSIKSLIIAFISFGKSFYVGAKIIFTHRKFLWIFFAYTLTLYTHRYLEDGIAPQLAKRSLGNTAWTEIIIGGSNFGELIGSICIYVLSTSIHSPLPYLRLSSLMLLLVWYIPFYHPPMYQSRYAWIIAITLIPISLTWAMSDVSLSAYIQSEMTRLESSDEHVSILGSVMAFLYSSYIIFYAIANPILGKYLDRIYETMKTIRPAIIYTIGLQFSVAAIIIICCTFIPKNAFQLNPTLEDEQQYVEDEEPDESKDVFLD